jgi:uncharacterized cupin superfamily protein
MMKPIINIAEIELRRPAQYAPAGPAAERFDVRVGMIAPSIGAKKLGYNVTAVPPGKRAYPYHNHRGREEMFYVLEGAGEVRVGAQTFPVRAGDIIACPPGGPETAHQLVNTGSGELKYLAVSTMEAPDVCEYPDSGKVAALGEGLRVVFKADQQAGYWEGE